jgi:hypothetical protein
VSPTLPAPLAPLPGGRVEPASRPAAVERMRAEGLEPLTWSNGPGDRYSGHEHAYAKLLACAEGSITFLVGADQTPVELRAGDGFELPAGTRHAAVVGPDGCTCVEAHRR